MTDYTKTVNFAAKDALATGNPAKTAKGTEVDTELNNIATSIATKYDSGDTVAVADGSAATPGLVFASDLDTGIYRSAANNLSVAAGGAAVLLVAPTGIYSIDGSAANPSISFTSDTDTGFFHSGVNTIGVASNGVSVVSFGPALTQVGVVLGIADGNATTPGIAFSSDLDTGFCRIGANTITVSFGGVDQGIVTGRTAGSFTGTITGMSGATTGTFYYNKTGLVANVFTIASILGTSNSADMTITGLPAAIQPANSVRTTCVVVDNNADCLAETNISGGTIGLRSSFVSGTKVLFADSVFTSSGLKGVPNGFCLTYSLA
jgi:hypothetical protein